MDAWLLMQYVLIGLAVTASLAVVMRKQFPEATRRLRIAIALPLLGKGMAPWMQWLGRRIAPAASAGASNCAGCDSCD
ncbi:MAG: DUF6587 family protein [Pseudomonadota bacterium]